MIFTTFDIAALLTVLVCLSISAMRGLMGEVVSFAGWIVALILARALAVPVSDIVFTSMNPRPMAVVCAFMLVYIVARIAIALLHQVLDLVVKKVKLSGVNRMLGGILGTIKGVLVVGLVVLACSFSNTLQEHRRHRTVFRAYRTDGKRLSAGFLGRPSPVAQQGQYAGCFGSRRRIRTGFRQNPIIETLTGVSTYVWRIRPCGSRTRQPITL